MKLEAAVEHFAGLTFAARDIDLERAWIWGDYDEGLRYAFFRTYEQLRDLAAELAAQRMHFATPTTPAQHILGQYIAAFWDMKAALLGINDELALHEPNKSDWPLRTILLHILKAERTFFAILVYSIERFRRQDGRPLALSDADLDRFWAGDPFETLKVDGSYTEIMAYFEGLHRRVLEAFIDLNEAELAAPSVFWESTPMPVRFRLHRFDAHMRQHTVQIDKTRAILGHEPNEAQRLLRLVYAALAEVQAVLYGVGEVGLPLLRSAATEIAARCDEIDEILKGEFHARPPD